MQSILRKTTDKKEKKRINKIIPLESNNFVIVARINQDVVDLSLDACLLPEIFAQRKNPYSGCLKV